MSGEERGGETFLARLCQGSRLTVPYTIREKLGLKKGDFLRVRVCKEEAGG